MSQSGSVDHFTWSRSSVAGAAGCVGGRGRGAGGGGCGGLPRLVRFGIVMRLLICPPIDLELLIEQRQPGVASARANPAWLTGSSPKRRILLIGNCAFDNMAAPQKRYLGDGKLRATMATARKISGQVVLIAWAAVLLMALFSVVLLADWYDNGHLRICLPEDTIGPPTGNYRPPEKTSDLDTPPYWCALQENRAAKSHGLPPPNVSVEYQRTHELDKSNCYSMNSTLRTPYIPKRTSLSNDNKIINLLGDDECPGTYEAIKGSWWSNDILSHVVYRTLLPILSWLTSTLDALLNYHLIPGWNEYFAEDTSASSTHRNAIRYIAIAIFVAMIGIAAKTTADWLHEIVLFKRVRDSDPTK